MLHAETDLLIQNDTIKKAGAMPALWLLAFVAGRYFAPRPAKRLLKRAT